MKRKIFVWKKQKVSIHRTWQNKLLREFTRDISPQRVLNLGARPDDKDKEGSRYKDYFPSADFWSLDTRPFDHPKYIQGDLMNPSRDFGKYDLVLCMSVIEHIEKPWLAAPVVSNLLVPGGYLYIAMPWFYPTHESRDYGDHWRARPSGIEILFDDLEVIESEYYPSAVKVVRDRKQYWSDPDSSACGASLLLKK